MRLPLLTRRTPQHVAAVIALAVACAVPLAAQAPKPVQTPVPVAKTSATVDVAALEQLLPTLTGWTRTRTNRGHIDLSEDCAYSFAEAVYTNAAMKVRITLADTAADPYSLGALATMVLTLKDDYVGTIDATTTVRRLALNGSPAATRWDVAKLDGEFIVVLSGRFVAKIEGTGVDSIETLQGLLERVDLKALVALK